jgi:hypothetical protein
MTATDAWRAGDRRPPLRPLLPIDRDDGDAGVHEVVAARHRIRPVGERRAPMLMLRTSA